IFLRRARADALSFRPRDSRERRTLNRSPTEAPHLLSATARASRARSRNSSSRSASAPPDPSFDAGFLRGNALLRLQSAAVTISARVTSGLPPPLLQRSPKGTARVPCLISSSAQAS